MYAFLELYEKSDYPFCYLLGVLKRMPKPSQLCPRFFSGEFDWMMTVEEQSDTVKKTQNRSELIKNFILPSAPLTMAPAWSPFPLAFSVLPDCVRHGRDEGEYHNSAYAIWRPKLAVTGESHLVEKDTGRVVSSFKQFVSDADIDFENIHARHFFWLLEMTVLRAQEMKGHVILAGTPGFSYSNAVMHEVPAHTRVRLLQAGYLYPSRVPQAARGSATDSFDRE